MVVLVLLSYPNCTLHTSTQGKNKEKKGRKRNRNSNGRIEDWGGGGVGQLSKMSCYLRGYLASGRGGG